MKISNIYFVYLTINFSGRKHYKYKKVQVVHKKDQFAVHWKTEAVLRD